VEIAIYKADFEIVCWHEYCVRRCNWLDTERCILFDQKLKKEDFNAYDEGPDTLRCKSCVTLCANLEREDEESRMRRVFENNSAKVIFEKISVKGIKTWRDTEGHKRRQTKTFSQTRSPFNRNANGRIKTVAEIYKELFAEREAWFLIPGEDIRDEADN
jgi:hypothetical protein